MQKHFLKNNFPPGWLRTLAMGILVAWAGAKGENSTEAVVEAMNKGQLETALQLIDNVIESNNNSGQAYFLKALIFTKMKKVSHAIAPIELAIKKDNKNPEFFKLAGYIYESEEKEQLALGAWKKCLKFSTQEKDRREAQKHIDLLSGK